MNKLFAIFLVILSCIAFTTDAQAEAVFPLGTGTNDGTYIIETAAQLNEVRNYLSSHFKLSNDIDLSQYLEP